MRARRRAVLVLGALAAGAWLLGTAEAGPKEERWLSFRAYPGARKLCTQHVTGTTMHINWALYATEDEPERVRRFYEKHAGGASIDREGGKLVRLRGPRKEILSVHGVKDRYPSCGVAPSARDRTAIVVSQAT